MPTLLFREQQLTFFARSIAYFSYFHVMGQLFLIWQFLDLLGFFGFVSPISILLKLLNIIWVNFFFLIPHFYPLGYLINLWDYRPPTAQCLKFEIWVLRQFLWNRFRKITGTKENSSLLFQKEDRRNQTRERAQLKVWSCRVHAVAKGMILHTKLLQFQTE